MHPSPTLLLIEQQHLVDWWEEALDDLTQILHTHPQQIKLKRDVIVPLVAHDVWQGIAMIEPQQVALAFVSLALPDTPGVIAIQHLRTAAPDLPIIAIINPGEETLGECAMQHGALDYLTRGRLSTTDRLRVMACARAWAAMSHRFDHLMLQYRASEARFQSIITHNADGIVMVDWNGIIRFVNQAAEELLGRTGAELLGATFGFPIVVGETIEIDVVRRNSPTVVAEMRVVESEWEGKIAYVASLRDITDRKQMEETLERLRHQNELILQSAGEGIYGLDVHGRATFVNSAATTMLGYTSEELIGRMLHDKIHHTKPDGSPYPWEECHILETFRNQTVSSVDDEVFWRKDGTCFPVEYVSTPILERGHLLGAVVIFHNIAARRQGESRRAMQLEVTQVLAQAETLDRGIPKVIQVICHYIGWDVGEMWQIEGERHRLRRYSVWYAPSLTLKPSDDQVSLPMICARGEGFVGSVWARGIPDILTDISTDILCQRTASTVSPPLTTVAAFPIVNSGDVVGVIAFFSRDSQQVEIDEDLFTLMSDIGNRIGQFIARKHAEEERWRYAMRLEMISKIDRSILTVQSPTEIISIVLSHLHKLVDCQHVSVSLFEHHTQLMENSDPAANIANIGNPQSRPPLPITHAPLPDESLIVDHSGGAPIHAHLCLPLISRGLLIGTLNLGTTQEHSFSKENIEIAREVANQLAIAMQQAWLFEEVRTSGERLKILSRRLMEAQEAERHHIARELHDEIGQALTAVKMSMQAVQRLLDGSALKNHIDESIVIVDRALQQVRNLSLDLRPSLLDDLGLAAALRWYVDRQARLAGFVPEFGVELGENRLPPSLETVCFRVVQEAVTNITRHAHAKRVRIDVWQDEVYLFLSVRDDGVGFDVREAQNRAVKGTSMGLLGMEERVVLAGGQFAINSVVGQGTEIQVCFSLAEDLPRLA